MENPLNMRVALAALLASGLIGLTACSSDEGSSEQTTPGKDASADVAADGGEVDGEVPDVSSLDGGGQDGSSSTDAQVDAKPDASEFHCQLPAKSPSLEPQDWQHPLKPVAGQAVTIILKSGNTKPKKAPKLEGLLINRNGTQKIHDYTLVGGGNAYYYVTFSPLAEGENCLVIQHDGHVEFAKKIVAPAPTPVPKGNGVWKITSNHQWTCDEQPTWGNYIRAKVLDENGKPMKGVQIDIRWTDDVVYPVKPDKNAKSWEEHKQPKSMVTGDDGVANMMTPWGEGNRTPLDGKSGMVVFLLSVHGGASDVATEITSALWESTYDNCNYCNKFAVNVYGHWSYTVTFQRKPDAKQVCEVGTDHAGQKKCHYSHFYHDPDHPSCLPVAQ